MQRSRRMVKKQYWLLLFLIQFVGEIASAPAIALSESATKDSSLARILGSVPVRFVQGGLGSHLERGRSFATSSQRLWKVYSPRTTTWQGFLLSTHPFLPPMVEASFSSRYFQFSNIRAPPVLSS